MNLILGTDRKGTIRFGEAKRDKRALGVRHANGGLHDDMDVRLLAIVVRKRESLSDLETAVLERLKLVGRSL